MDHHISQEKILLYLLHEMEKDELKNTEIHFRTCPQCKNEMERVRSFMAMVKGGALTPGESVLARNRQQLRLRVRQEAMDKAQGKFRRRIKDIINIRIPVRQLAAAAIVFILGLALGNVMSGRMNPLTNETGQALSVLQSAMPVGDFHVRDSDEFPGQVEILFKAVNDQRVVGEVSDPDVQFALAYALVNAPRDNIRLQSINLLRPQLLQTSVETALLHAVEKDDNPGIRLKAMKLLQTLPVNNRIKDILLSALFHDTNNGIRIEAANALSQVDDESILPILQKKAEDDDYIQTLLQRMQRNQPVSLEHE